MSLKLLPGVDRTPRQKLDLCNETDLPTTAMMRVLRLVKVLSRLPLLFASIAASAFLILLDLQHVTNTIRTQVLAHPIAAVTGFLIWDSGPAILRAAPGSSRSC